MTSIYICLDQKEMKGRWFTAQDMNCDGAFTISDVGLWFNWVFFLPGDFVMWTLMQKPGLATFFEISAYSFGGWPSGVISAILWLVALGMLSGDRG